MPLSPIPPDLALRLLGLEFALQYLHRRYLQGEYSHEEWVGWVDLTLGCDRTGPCTPRCGYDGGLPTRERPHHIHIVDTLDNWLFNDYIKDEQHKKLTNYVIRWSGDGLGGCRKLSPVPCALAGPEATDEAMLHPATDEDGSDTDPYGDIEHESSEDEELGERVRAARKNYLYVELPAAKACRAAQKAAEQAQLMPGKLPNTISPHGPCRKRKRSQN